MNFYAAKSPPPPSPSASEPPPTYDTLASIRSHPPLHIPVITPSTLEEHRRHSLLSPQTTDDPDPIDGGEEPDALPPPYTPGSRNNLGVSTDQYEGPPSYYSLFGQIQEAHQQSRNSFTFLRKLGQIVLNTVGCIILMMVFMSVPLTVLVLGVVYVKHCPLQPLVPIFLIIGGLSGILKNIFLIIESVIRRRSTSFPREQHSKYIVCGWRSFNFLFNLFMLGWIIAGSCWIYSIYKQVTEANFSSCNELLYKFSFAIVTCSYVLLLVMFCCTCCLGGCLSRNKHPASSSTDGGVSGGGEGGMSGGRERDEEGSVDRESRSTQPLPDAGAMFVCGEGLGVEGMVELQDDVAEVGRAVHENACEAIGIDQRDNTIVSVERIHSSTPGSTLVLHYESSPYLPQPSPRQQVNFSSHNLEFFSFQSTQTQDLKNFRNAFSYSFYDNLPSRQRHGMRTADRPFSMSSLCEPQSHNLRHMLRMHGNHRTRNSLRFSVEGNETSSHSSLYNTINFDGYSITAV